jgi:hypothetical protein
LSGAATTTPLGPSVIISAPSIVFRAFPEFFPSTDYNKQDVSLNRGKGRSDGPVCTIFGYSAQGMFDPELICKSWSAARNSTFSAERCHQPQSAF